MSFTICLAKHHYPVLRINCEVLKDYFKLWHVDDLWTPVRQLWTGWQWQKNLSNLIERGLCLCFTNDFLSCCLKTRIYPLGHLKRWNVGISHMCFSEVKHDVISCWNPSINVKYTLFSLLAHIFHMFCYNLCMLVL
jgi:hypothetical protein